MAYTKAYTDKPIWHNDTDPAINETRLNDLCGAVDTIDDRVIEIDGKELQGISNVSVSDLQNNQGLKWDSTQQKWVNGVVGGSVDITYANYMALVNQDLDDPDILYNITDLNFTAGNVLPISYAEYQALTTAQKNDGTARFVYDYPLANTYIDDSSTTSLTRGWSANKLNNEFGTINTKLSSIIGYVDIRINARWQGTEDGYKYMTYNASDDIPQGAKLMNVGIAETGGALTYMIWDIRGDNRIFLRIPSGIAGDSFDRYFRLIYFIPQS